MNNVQSRYKESDKKMISCKDKQEVILKKALNLKLENKNNSQKYILINTLEINCRDQIGYGLNRTKIQRPRIKKQTEKYQD